MIDTTGLTRWIAEHATGTEDGDGLLDGLCRRLVALGLPLWRCSISVPAIDPAARGASLTWHETNGVSLAVDAHGDATEAAWRRSAIYALLEGGVRSRRWRLDALGLGDSFPILHELRAQGGTEFVLHLIGFAPGTALRGVALSFATRRASGFDAADLAAIEAVLPTLGLAVAKLSLSHTLREVLGTYLGRSTAERVLDGQIRRGQGRTVPAAILLVDLRGFTALSDNADPLAVVGWLDEHFDALGDPVARHGGEILKFLGDGFLAVFPVPDAGTLPCPVCAGALHAASDAMAANAALNTRRRAEDLPELSADCVLHFGEVVYGNVGTSRRLDFTMIGRAVNEASRIEGACEALGHALLISDSFAARCHRPLEAVGTVELRGLARPRRVWTLRA